MTVLLRAYAQHYRNKWNPIVPPTDTRYHCKLLEALERSDYFDHEKAGRLLLTYTACFFISSILRSIKATISVPLSLSPLHSEDVLLVHRQVSPVQYSPFL